MGNPGGNRFDRVADFIGKGSERQVRIAADGAVPVAGNDKGVCALLACNANGLDGVIGFTAVRNAYGDAASVRIICGSTA